METRLLSSLGTANDLTLETCASLDVNLLVPDYSLFILEYTILCTTLRKKLNKLSGDAVIDDETTNQLLTARKIAIALAYLYENTFPDAYSLLDANKFRLQEAYWRELLNEEGSPLAFNPLKNPWESANPNTLHPTLLSNHPWFNWGRLFLGRCRRTLNSVRPFVMPDSPFHPIMDKVETVANPFFTYFAWAFFVPRLFTNFYLMATHLIPNSGMPEKEKTLNLSARWQVNAQRRGFELANDVVFIASGLLCCFLLIGSLATVGTYLVAALYAYDIFLAGLRAFIELRRLNHLKTDYTKQNVPEIFQQQLNAQWAYTRRNVYLNVAYMTALTLAVALTIPLLAANPLLPLIGAALLVAITIAAFTALRLNERTKPVPPSLSRHNFFKPAPVSALATSEPVEKETPDAVAPTEPATDSASPSM